VIEFGASGALRVPDRAIAVRAVNELRPGRKQTHWMWFVFPQLRGLGRSSMAEYYGNNSLAGARAYLAHPVLGPRLDLCTRTVLEIEAPSLNAIFGSPDEMKLGLAQGCSCSRRGSKTTRFSARLIGGARSARRANACSDSR
jgi:uncharacterized protein (DUF1810 family)